MVRTAPRRAHAPGSLLSFGALAAAGLVSALASGCGGGGGGGEAPPLSVSFSISNLNFAEDGGPQTLSVALNSSLGPLTEAVSILVSDEGVGSATSGVDYTAFPPQRLEFPIGAVDGDQLSVVLDILDDSDVEPPESVRLRIEGATGGAALAGPTVLTVEIADDEPKTGAFAFATDASGGVLANNQLVTIANTPLGGSSSAVRISIENLGANAFKWEPPVLNGDAGDFQIELVEVNGTPLPAPLPASLPVANAPTVRPWPYLRTSADLAAPGALVPDVDALSALKAAPQLTLTDVPWPARGAASEQSLTLELEPVPSALTDAAVLTIDGAPTTVGELELDTTLWRGAVAGYPHSRAFLGLSCHGSRGWIRLTALGPTLHVVSEPASDPDAAPVRLLFDEYLPEGLERFDLPRCASAIGLTPTERAASAMNVSAPAQDTPSIGAAPDVASVPTGAWSPRAIRLILETDTEFHDLFGSVPATINYTNQLMSSVSDLFERHLQCRIDVVQLNVYPGGDPFVPQFDADALSMLAAVREAYAPALGGSWPVAAELVHMLSGDNLGGGVAYVDVVGNQDFGFGVSGDLTGSINWGTFTGAPDPLIWDYSVLAHELGHGFGSQHTHEYCPPIDRCYEGCETSVVCGESSLMSYCHLCPMGLANIEPRFHALTSNEMRRLMPSNLADPMVGGDVELVFEVRFQPYSGAGSRTTTVSFTHDAPNLPSPFKVRFEGVAQ
ncbi:hypothetical protein Pla163_12260 [Planctomycetes bacterium Pla163]|uniref:Peptidase M12B domain-containing protein n=1 Tax=Rohdeia mirabilis TaxID=2528008 RepID=A0A518CY13_9BACT|nr:hypothetical protein Pla163_12260 [Planctomycetes bacterium Pla163]